MQSQHSSTIRLSFNPNISNTSRLHLSGISDTHSSHLLIITEPRATTAMTDISLTSDAKLKCEQFAGKANVHHIDTGPAGQREFWTYFSRSACSGHFPKRVVFFLHCYGCSPAVMLKFAKPLVENNGFIAVVPKGVRNSFNAQVCCGYAMEKKIDDLACLRLIRDRLSSTLPAPSMVSPELTFAVGWSNGAYLATLDAVQSKTDRVFAAVVPISGFQPLPAEGIAPLPVFMHHSRDDSLVRFGGCCRASASESCCCRISELSPQQCTSTQEYFQQIARLNKCDLDAQVVTFNRTRVRRGRFSSEVVCRGYQRCERNVTFCEYEDYGHFNRKAFHTAFPVWMQEEITRFLASAKGLDHVEVHVDGLEREPEPSTHSMKFTALATLLALLLIIVFMARNMRLHRRVPYAVVHQSN